MTLLWSHSLPEQSICVANKVGLGEIENISICLKSNQMLSLDTYPSKVVKNTWTNKAVLSSKEINFIRQIKKLGFVENPIKIQRT